MCMLCGETAEQGKREALDLARRLKALASIQEGLATGRIKPHSDMSGRATALAIIRTLVAEYL